MEKCLECGDAVKREWYIPTSHGGITPFCSESCANTHADSLAKQEGYIMGKVDPKYPNEIIIDTGTQK